MKFCGTSNRDALIFPSPSLSISNPAINGLKTTARRNPNTLALAWNTVQLEQNETQRSWTLCHASECQGCEKRSTCGTSETAMRQQRTIKGIFYLSSLSGEAWNLDQALTELQNSALGIRRKAPAQTWPTFLFPLDPTVHHSPFCSSCVKTPWT